LHKISALNTGRITILLYLILAGYLLDYKIQEYLEGVNEEN